MDKNELTAALKETAEVIEKKNAELLEAVKAESKAEAEKLRAELKEAKDLAGKMQEQLDQATADVKKLAFEPTKEVKSFADSLRESLTKEAEKITGMGRKYTQALQLEIKSFLETANASVTTGSLLPIPQFEMGVSKAPDRAPFILDIISKGVASSLTIYWTQRKTRTDKSGVVTEGTLTTLASETVIESILGYETKSASMQNLSAYIKVSNNSIEDIDWLLSEVQTELVTLMMLNLDEYILKGTSAVNGFDGILEDATAFDAGGAALDAGVVPNRFDALVFALNQVRVANFNPNYIVLHPSDIRDMKLTRDDNGSYMLPPTMAVGGLAVDGVRVISNTGMTAGSYLVGDFTKAKFWTRKGMELKVWEQNEDDAIKQLKTISLYMRGTLVIKEADVAAFVTDTFKDTITEITKQGS